jgi:hypothetical protein
MSRPNKSLCNRGMHRALDLHGLKIAVPTWPGDAERNRPGPICLSLALIHTPLTSVETSRGLVLVSVAYQ